jgi:alkaline phosphatase
MDRQNDEITVAEFTAKAIELLDNPNGFFVMVEGGKIDWACHANDAVATIRDTIAFDEAVGVAMNFYREHPDETLVVVTGDHETGGLSIGFAGTRYDSFMGKLSSQKVSFEAWDQLFGEFRDNAGKDVTLDDIMPQITENFGLVKVSAAERRDLEKKADNGDEKASRILGLALKNYEVQQLEKAFARSMASEKERSEDDQTYLQYGGYEPLTVSITHILNQKAGLAWTSYAHTGVPVPVSAIGAGEEMFNGYYDNTDVFSKIANAMGLITEQVAAK